MRFMMLVKSAGNSGPPPKELMDAIAKLGEDANKSGTMIETGGLAPAAMSTRVRLAQGKITATDGPFAETKELVGGYAIFEFKSKQEAIDSTLHFMDLHPENTGPAGKGKPKSARSSPKRITPSNRASRTASTTLDRPPRRSRGAQPKPPPACTLAMPPCAVQKSPGKRRSPDTRPPC